MGIPMEARDAQYFDPGYDYTRGARLEAPPPTGFSTEPSIRYQGRDIPLDEAEFPRVDGIMGAARPLRNGVRKMQPRTTARLETGQPNQKESPAALIARAVYDLGGPVVSAYGIARGKRKGNVALITLGVGGLLGSGSMLISDITACAPIPTETASVPVVLPETPTEVAPDMTDPQNWTVEYLRTVPDLEPWQTIPYTETGMGIPYARISTDVPAHTDNTVKAYHPQGNPDDVYVFGRSTYAMQGAETWFTTTVFHQDANNTMTVRMLDMPQSIDEQTTDWQLYQMVNDTDTSGNVLARNVEEDKGYKVRVRSLGADIVTYSLVSSSGEEIPLELIPSSTMTEPVGEPTRVLYADYNAVFTFSTGERINLTGAPEGTTGKDAKTGEWTKPNPEHPDRPLYYKTIPNTEVEGWYWTAGNSNLINEQGFGNTMPFALWCEEGVQCPIMRHPPTVATGTELSFSKLMASQLDAREAGKPVQYIPPEEKAAFYEKLHNNKIVIPFTTDDGSQYQYNIRPESRFNVYIKKDALPDPDINLASRFYMTIVGDEHGNLHSVEYSPDPISSMSDKEFVQRYFSYPFMVLYTDDMSEGSVKNKSGSPSLAGLAAWMVKGDHPYFVLTR